MAKTGRNEQCPCGSGKKFKKCCDKSVSMPPAERRAPVGAPPTPIPGCKLQIPRGAVFNGYRFRPIWNRLYPRKETESFHDFLVWLLCETMGDSWVREQKTLLPTDQHVVARWINEVYLQRKSASKTSEGAFVVSGQTKAALSFAFDLYCLQIVNKLPDSLVQRLRSRDGFQGAWYEVAIAALFARADFEVTLLDEPGKTHKHCEFTARHRASGAEVYVEAKSRHRGGVLNTDGVFDPAKHVKGDIFRLYHAALEQAPPANPFLVFIDANLPVDTTPPSDPSGWAPIESIHWVRKVKEQLDREWAAVQGKTPDTAVVVTNYAYHYGATEERSPSAFFVPFASPNPAHPMPDNRPLDDLFNTLRNRGGAPREI